MAIKGLAEARAKFRALPVEVQVDPREPADAAGLAAQQAAESDPPQ